MKVVQIVEFVFVNGQIIWFFFQIHIVYFYLTIISFETWGGVKSRIRFPLMPTNFHSVSAWPTLPACWYLTKPNISGKYVHGNGEHIHCFTLTLETCHNSCIAFKIFSSRHERDWNFSLHHSVKLSVSGIEKNFQYWYWLILYYFKNFPISV